MPKASVLTEAYFQDEGAAFNRLEAIIWPNGPVCPKCGCSGRIGSLKGVKDKKGRERLGLRKCYDCRAQFTIRVGTVFERSHVPLHVWFQAAYLMCSSKKGISSNQLSRTLGVTLQTAWFMSHRLRLAMAEGSLPPLSSGGGTVEVDETYIGRLEGQPKRRVGWGHKNTVLTLVERGGPSRTFHVEGVGMAHLWPIIRANVSPEAHLRTDEAVKRADRVLQGIVGKRLMYRDSSVA
ncbi:MAG TPA: IS1595 family transposase [Beijerinckiaceae bacterium]|jgi:transposase-like protein